jgi:hypothetical protein
VPLLIFFLARASEKGFRKAGEGALFGAITQLSPTLRKPFVAGRSRNGINRGTLKPLFMLDAREISHNRIQWTPIDRLRALAVCSRESVVVVHRTRGREAVERLTPSSAFFRGVGAFNYRQLRYFLKVSAEAGQVLAPEAVGVARPVDKNEDEHSKGENLLEKLFPDEDPKKDPFPVTFSLRRKNGKPFPATPYEVTLPDGAIRSGVSGADGFIRVLDNAVSGQATLRLIPDPSAKAKVLQPFAKPKPRKHPIDVTLMDGEGNPLAGKVYELLFENSFRLSGTSNAEGKVLHPDNELEGKVKLILAAVSPPLGATPIPLSPEANING